VAVREIVLVTGATGNVGRQVVDQLVGGGAGVRALVRKPEGAGLPDGVELVRGDLADPASLDAALAGVDVVFLVWPFLGSDGASAVVDAIARRARRVVYLSSMGVRDDRERQADSINQSHAELERLIASSGVDRTILRSGGMATNTLGWAPQVRAEGVVRWPFAEARRSLVHERDVAAVAVRALTEDGHAGAAYPLTGPESLTQAAQVRAIGEAIGRPVRFEEIPPEAAREELLAEGLPSDMVDGMLAAWARMVEEPEPVLPTVEEVTGTPARTYRRWAADHADDFR
jgi:uncharacterized protein YbjT (DUF2867 family)